MSHITEAFAETFGGPPEKDYFVGPIAAGVLLLIILALAGYGALHLAGIAQ
jgi:hypothetical protein